MVKRIMGLFLAGSVLELVLLIAAGSWLGVLPVLGLLVLSAVAGSMVMRHYGIKSLMRLQAELQQSGRPEISLSLGIFGTLAGLLLIAPGFLSDVLGLVLLVPAVQKQILKRFMPSPGSFAGSGRAYRRVVIIEGEAVEVDPESVPRPPLTREPH